jgi:putative ABC transport system ATP-binding protein
MKAVAQLPRLLAQPGPSTASLRAPSSLTPLYRCASKIVPSTSCRAAVFDPTRFRAFSSAATVPVTRPRNAFPTSTRSIFSSAILRQAKPLQEENAKESTEIVAQPEVQGFERSEKASKAAQVNLSARLHKDGKATGKAGFGEIVRLLSIARPEAKWLGGESWVE